MRAVILILILIVAAFLVAIGTGYLNINQVRPAQTPDISTTQNGVVAKGGQAPAFEVETGSIKVGTTQTTVKVPSLEVQRPGNQADAANNNAQ